MNREKLLWGAILLMVGSMLLLDNLSIVDFNWRAVVTMWPIVIVVFGANLLLPKKGTGRFLSLVVTFLAVIFLAYVGISTPKRQNWRWDKTKNWKENMKSQTPEVFRSVLTQDNSDQLTRAKLKIQGAAGSYVMDGVTTEELFWSENKSSLAGHTLDYSLKSDGLGELVFKMDNTDGQEWGFSSKQVNVSKIRLHKDPVWDISFDIGAASTKLDLQEYKISRLDVDCGASAISMKLGQPYRKSEIKVESGAASVKLEIPEGVHCKIVVNSGLSSKSFPGFEKQDDGTYLSSGYQESEDHYNISLSGGVSSFSVKRYEP